MRSEMEKKMRIFSYVVEHDEGREPNPYSGSCTLCRCKFSEKAESTQGQRGRKNIVELAEEGDWIIGTGGLSPRSIGRHGTLIYAMRVDQKLTRWDFFKQYPNKNSERPRGEFQKNMQFALVSHHFYYFGANAIDIPTQFAHFEKRGPGFRYVKDQAEFKLFLQHLKQFKRGKQGEPCSPKLLNSPKGGSRCKSSC